MTLTQVHPSSRTHPPQGWTVVYADDGDDPVVAHIDYDPPAEATDEQIVAAVSRLLSEREAPIPVTVLSLFRGRHTDLVSDVRQSSISPSSRAGRKNRTFDEPST